MAEESPPSAPSDDPASDDPATDPEPDVDEDVARPSTTASATADAGDPADGPTDGGADPGSDEDRPDDPGQRGAHPAAGPRSSDGDAARDDGPQRASTPAGQTAATVDDGLSRDGDAEPADDVPADVRQYDRFKKIDGARYERVNEFLRDRTYITAREWAIARLCADFRTETGSEMTKIGENLPELVPFMTDTYTPQAVNQARAAFEDKVRKAGATFLYGAMCDFFTADQLDEVMYEATEVAKFLLEVEGVDLAVEEELEAEDRISSVMREVRHASESLRYEGVECPHCGEAIDTDGHEN